VTEVAAAAIAALVPVPGELDLAALIAGNAEEDEREAPGLVLHPPPLIEAQHLKVCNSGVRIGQADHLMEEFHFI
jgi:hypothetical protein